MNWLSKFRRMSLREPTVTVVIDDEGSVGCRRAPGPYDYVVGVYTSSVTDDQLIEDLQAAIGSIPRGNRRYLRVMDEQ